MLLYAVLACGACHLSLVNNSYAHSNSQALYDKASGALFRHLHNPHRNSFLCAITALVLNAFEMMTEQELQKMNHIAGARALIKECGWNANSSGAAARCFWFNISTQLLNSIIYNWTNAWDPGEWGHRLEKPHLKPMENAHVADEWIYAILHLLARIINYSLTATQSHVSEDWDADADTGERLEYLCAWWWRSLPQELQPLMDSERSATSSFPCIKYIFPSNTLLLGLD